MSNSKTITYDDVLKTNSTFIKIADGETVTAKVKNLEIRQIPGFQGAESKLGVALVLDTEYGDKRWESSARKVIEQMRDLKVSVNDTISITRTGISTDTKYQITVLS